MKKIWNLIRFMLLKKTKKHKGELRKQRVRYNGQRMMAIDWIDDVSIKLPPMAHDGKHVCHFTNLKKWYYKYDIAGANYYIETVRNTTKDYLIRFESNLKAKKDDIR